PWPVGRRDIMQDGNAGSPEAPGKTQAKTRRIDCYEQVRGIASQPCGGLPEPSYEAGQMRQEFENAHLTEFLYWEPALQASRDHLLAPYPFEPHAIPA